MIELVEISGLLLVLLAVLLAGGVWIAIALMACGYVGMQYVGGNIPAGPVLATTIWGNSASWTLAALPLFIWMGEILFRTKLSEEMFRGLAPWLNRIPGRLMHVNVLACGIFGSVSGSSAATCATVAKIALPELKKRGLMFVGIDVIGGMMTEINVTSPTGARALKNLSGINAVAKMWDVIEAKAK